MPLSELIELSRRSDELLLARWSSHTPLEKAALFKLMPRERALAFFRVLPFAEQYLMILAAPMGSIAPLLEDAPPAARAQFHTLSKADLDALVDAAYAQPA